MTDTPYSHPLALAKLPKDGTHEIQLTPDASIRTAIAQALGITTLRKLSGTATLSPEGARDWRLTLQWGATVVQPCVATLAPVTTRIDQTDTLRLVADLPEITEAETEMPDDEMIEPLTDAIDLGEILTEMLALALPVYPRAQGVELDTHVFAAPGVTPMTDEDARPFAGLAALKDQLTQGKDDPE